MSSKFYYSSSSTKELSTPDSQKSALSATQTPQSNNTPTNLILPDSVKNANIDLTKFGSFAGPIPDDNNNKNTINKSNNNNSNNDNPLTLRLIIGNRVNIPPAQK